jgi:hypothetical protein
MSMARTKESLAVDAEDSLRENNNRNSRMCPVPPQGVLKWLNTSFAAPILCDPPETNQMTTERKEGRFRREIGSNLFRRMGRARFASLLGIRNPPTFPTPIPSSNETYPASSVASSHSPSPSISQRSSNPALAEEQPGWQINLHELKSVVHSILQAYPNYIGFIV